MLVFKLFCNPLKTIDVWPISFDKRFLCIDKNQNVMHDEHNWSLNICLKMIGYGHFLLRQMIDVHVTNAKA